MKRRQPDFSRQPKRLQSYLDSLTRTVGHADRVVPLENYTKGLLLPLERKSVEPMAARLAPGNVRQMHQSLHHIVADAAWSDAALLKAVRDQVLPAMTRRHRLGSIVGRWVSRRTAVLLSACRWPASGPVFLCATSCICLTSGLVTESDAEKQEFRKRSGSRLSLR
jgi:hypothetical protein